MTRNAKCTKVRLAALGAALVVAVVASGQTSSAQAAEADKAVVNPIEIGVFGGLHVYEKLHGLGRTSDMEEGFSPATGPAFGLRLTYNLNEWLGLEAEGMFSPTHTGFSDDDKGTSINVLGYRAQAIVNFLHEGYVRPFAVLGFGALSSFPKYTDDVFSDTDGMFHLGLGAKFPITDMFGLRLDLRVMAPPAIASDIATVGDETGFDGPDYEALLSGYVALGGEKPKAAPPPPPPPPADDDPDRDGVRGAADKCPTDAEDKDGFQDEDGCPDPDNDGDGILDGVDKCPTDAEDKDGFQDEDGCPDPDNDSDGILDGVDKCPNQAETKNNYQDQDGCPDEIPAAIKKFTGVIQGINFKTKSADILKGSFKVLDQAIKVLNEYPDVKLEISGHTDSVGKADFNKTLSQKRAESVKKYFVSKGIAENRLTAIGMGMDAPIADNATKEGKAKNRRTEFKLIE